MSLNFIDYKNNLKITQVNEGCPIGGLRLHVSEPDNIDYNTIIFDLSRDDVVILMRHLNAYIETGELMRI